MSERPAIRAWRGALRGICGVALVVLGEGCLGADPEWALDPLGPCREDGVSTCLHPTQPEAFYVDQGMRYFDSLDASADPTSRPTYSERVARWEWPPWLLLTGYGRDMIPVVDELVLAAQPDTTVPTRDCRFFGVQPFARCRVNMSIESKDCGIYEEFTFNDAGEITFVEAWSDLPGLGPSNVPNDLWAEHESAHRLSTRIPGLGNPDGLIDPTGRAMQDAADRDPEVADFVARTQDFWPMWAATLDAAGDDLYARGCGW